LALKHQAVIIWNVAERAKRAGFQIRDHGCSNLLRLESACKAGEDFGFEQRLEDRKSELTRASRFKARELIETVSNASLGIPKRLFYNLISH
jgi:hypothetical protein